jgi:hypothetical protein
MSNSYGFDFLRSEHKLAEDGTPLTSPPPEHASLPTLGDDELAKASLKPDLEKQFDILAFLQKHRGSGSALPPSLIYRATGIDLEERDAAVAQMLQANPKIRTEFIPDPENPSLLVGHYSYQAKYPSVRDRTSLLAQINRMSTGVPTRDLLDSYNSVAVDIATLITGGDVIAIQNTEDKDKILFPRGESFLVELDGLLALPDPRARFRDAVTGGGNGDKSNNANNGKKSPKMNGNGGAGGSNGHALFTNRDDPTKLFGVVTDVDPRKQIRRGEAVQVGGQWFRVSSAVKADAPLSEQPARAQAPLSVVSLTDLSKRNEVDGYVRPFSHKHLPLDGSLTETAQRNVQNAREARERLLKLSHGRTGGVTGQLTGSHAHSSNPRTLAASFATGADLHQRKRPNNKHSGADAVTSAASDPALLSKAALEKAAADSSLALFSHPRRHGCTRDVREMYLATRADVPESDHDLQQVLLQHKLLEPGEQIRRPRLAVKGKNLDNDGKPTKRRYYERKNQRMTNTHLEGTEIGAILARAAEKQKQGKSVGDGGM